jgi:thiol-disulfide isomerase/thioredoxin
VRIARPDKFRVEELVPTTLYVSDGRTQYHYQFAQGSRTEAIQQLPGASLLGTAWTAALLKAPADFGAGRAAGEQIIDGLRMRTYVSPTVSGYSTRISIEEATRLPYRVSNYEKTGTKEERETSRLDFRSWVFNEPIPASTFGWTPPESAQQILHPAPVLTRLSVGAQAPDFTVTAPDGRTEHLSDYHGKVVVLDFWATWCGPCQQEMPLTTALAKKYADRNVVILGICTSDKKASFLKWVAQHPEYRPIHFVYDGEEGDKSIEQALYHCKEVPVQYIISADGKVAAADVGLTVDRTTNVSTRKEIDARYARFMQDLSHELDVGIDKAIAH